MATRKVVVHFADGDHETFVNSTTNDGFELLLEENNDMLSASFCPMYKGKEVLSVSFTFDGNEVGTVYFEDRFRGLAKAC